MMRIILTTILLFLARFCVASTTGYEKCSWISISRIMKTGTEEYQRAYVKNCVIDSCDLGVVLILDSLLKLEDKSLMIEFAQRLLSTPKRSSDEILLRALTWNSILKWGNLDWIEQVVADETLRQANRFDLLSAAFERGRVDLIYLIYEELSAEDWRSETVFNLIKAPILENNYEFALFVLQNAIFYKALLPERLAIDRNLDPSQKEYLNSLLTDYNNKM